MDLRIGLAGHRSCEGLVLQRSLDSEFCAECAANLRSGNMAGRYDSNPFDEDEVNPFSVSNANAISASSRLAGSLSVSLLCIRWVVMNNQPVVDLSWESNARNCGVLRILLLQKIQEI